MSVFVTPEDCDGIPYAESVQWLRDVHGITIPPGACFEIVGNEDSPEQILVYDRNRVDCRPVSYVPDDNGRMVREFDLARVECPDSLYPMPNTF